ncbi:MAG: HypC/HybG/HupF family hydrogenase formation chaperone [Magnetococcales bacterium]|nr:HypC/HybG/HupF family hydrogenase formation chaperone [Magnetococcales bacterium]MBF0155739.1 HypC/HybG/HupF family hydrogenase formation chaperone [Magnetococcales bacterium]
MCLAVPMQLVAVEENGMGVVEQDGIRFGVGLMLVESPAIGDYLLVHAGYAIEKLDTAEADARLALFRSLAEIARQETGAEVTLVAPPRPPGKDP